MDQPPAPRARRWWRWALLGLVVLGALAGFAGLVLPHLKPTVLRVIAVRTGREVRVGGDLDTHLLALHPRLTVGKVYVGNPPWMPAGPFLEADKLTLELDWHFGMPLLQLRSLELHQATLHLLRDATGSANWQLHQGGGGRGPPLLRHLAASDVQVVLHDERRHLNFSGQVSAEDGSQTQPQKLLIRGEGQLNGRAATVTLTGDPLLLAQRGQPYHFTLEERSGTTQLSAHGALEDPFDFRYLSGTFSASGLDLKDLYFVVGIRLPDTGPFALSGRLTRRLEHFVYEGLRCTSGKSDVGGTLTVDVQGGQSTLSGALSSTRLRLQDLGARAAGRAADNAPQAPGELPATPFPVAGIRRGHARISYRAQALELGTHTFAPASAVVVIEHGVLSIEQLSAGLAGGTISGNGRLDASQNPPLGELELRAAGLQLDQLKGGSAPSEPPLQGELAAHARLRGRGQSPQELGASATGVVSAVIPHGVMRASLADLVSLDMTAALGLAMRRGAETDVRCAVASLTAQDGIAKLDSLVLDTESALITGSGLIHLDSQALDLKLRGRPKKPSLVLRAAVSVGGTLTHPQFHLAAHEMLAQAGAAVALGALLTPLAAVLAFVSPGLTHDADCSALLAQNSATHTAVQPATAPAPKPAEVQRRMP